MYRIKIKLATTVCSISFDLLTTTSETRDTIFHLCTMCGCYSIIELLQFTIVHFFWASLGKALCQKACHQDTIKRRNTHKRRFAIKIQILRGTSGRSRLIEQTLILMDIFENCSSCLNKLILMVFA